MAVQGRCSRKQSRPLPPRTAMITSRMAWVELAESAPSIIEVCFDVIETVFPLERAAKRLEQTR